MSYKKRIAAVISFVLATALLTLTASSNVVAQSARMGNGDWQPGCVLVYRSGSFDSEGLKAYIWSSAEYSEASENAAYAIYFGNDGSVSVKNFPKNNGFSVRCLKN